MPRRTGRGTTSLARGSPPAPRRQKSPRAPSSPAGEWVRIAGVAAIALKVLLVPIAFDPLGEDAFGVPKSALSRALMYALVVLGVSLLAMSQEARRRALTRRVMIGLLLAYGATAALSTFLAAHQGTALFGAHHRYLGLTSIADGIVLALALHLFVRSRADIQVVLLGLIAGGIAVMGYAVMQGIGVDPLRLGYPHGSLVGNRGVFAGYLVVVASVSAYLALDGLRGGTRRPALALGVVAVTGAVLAVRSDARGPTLALPLGLAIAVAFALRGGWRPPLVSRRARLALGSGVMAGALLLLAAGAPRLQTLFSPADTSLLERRVVYESGLRMVAARPVLGGGPDAFAVLFPSFRPVASAQLTLTLAPGQTSAHSWLLHHAVGTGITGVALLGALLVACLRRAWIRARARPNELAAAGAVIAASFVLQGIFNIASVGHEFLFWAGLGLAAATIEEDAGPRMLPPSRVAPSSVLPLAGALAVGLALAATTLNWIEANRDVRASDRLRAAGRLELAESAALSATQRDPGRANNWNVLGLARSPSSAARALAAFERAWAAAPYESRYLINVIKEEVRLAEAGQPSFMARALAHARQAVAIDPRNAETHMVLSFVLAKNGEPDEARREADLVIELAPSESDSYLWSTAIHEETGDPRGAVARYEMFLARTAAPTRPELRARLATLYVRAGLVERAASVAAPKLVEVRRLCDPLCSSLLLRFDAPLGLAVEGQGNAREPSKYRVDGRELPSGTQIALRDPQTIIISGPPNRELVRSGAPLVLTGITDSLGLRMERDPATIVIP